MKFTKCSAPTETTVAIFQIPSDVNQTITIEPKHCLDHSGWCPNWKRKGECENVGKRQFMNEHCQLSWGVCSEENDVFQMLEIKKKGHFRDNRNWGSEL